MLTNAIAGGILGAAYLLVLVLQLNPQVPTVSVTAVQWFMTMIAFYGLYLSVAIMLVILVREALATRPLAPAWLSVRLLAWLGAAAAGTAAIVTWANLAGYRAVLGGLAAERMRQGAVATTVCAVLLLLVALLRYSFGRRGSRTTATVFVLLLVLSVAVPIGLRGPGEVRVPAPRAPKPAHASGAASRHPRIRMILLDGASLGFIRQRVAANQLQNFGRMLERGGVVELTTIKPTQAAPIWAAAATGKYAPKTGVRSNAFYRVERSAADPVDLLPDYCFAYALVKQGFVHEDFQSRTSLHARPLWDILEDYGIRAGIVNWPLTFPAKTTLGYIISDRFDEGMSSPLRLGDQDAADPTTATDVARQVFDVWQLRSWFDVVPGFTSVEVRPTGLDTARWDRAYSESAIEMDQEFNPRVTAVRYEGLEEFGHTYLRDAMPEWFGESPQVGPPRSVLDRYYAFIDQEVGRAIAALDPDDLLVVVSGFGMQQESLTKRLVAQQLGWLLGWPERTGTHERAPDGFLLAYGTNVAHAELPRGAIVDLAPTVLYYLGLPVGRDMDGLARTDIFQRAYTLEHPVAYIGTFER
jgi:Type I phosphodiesterase / nucleotide pyrophosphatase